MAEAKKRTCMEYIHDQFWFWFSAEFFAVGLSAFLGVYVRVMIQNQLDGSGSAGPGVSDCSSGTGPFMQMFFSQTYLIPNFLGCFIMSFCIVNMKSITDISVPLYKALTTGLCGCITTFSTWMNAAVNCSFGYYSWYQILIMIGLEFWLTWGAFTLGFSAAKLFIDLWHRVYKIAFEVEVVVEENEREDESISATAPDISHRSLEKIEEGEDDDDDENSNKLRSTELSATSLKSASSAPASSTRRVSIEKATSQIRHSHLTKKVIRVDANAWGTSPMIERRSQNASRPRSNKLSRPSRTSNYEKLHPIASRISVWREDGEDDQEVDEEERQISSFGRSHSQGNLASRYSTADAGNLRTSRIGGSALSRTRSLSRSHSYANTPAPSRNDSKSTDSIEMRSTSSGINPINNHLTQNSSFTVKPLGANPDQATPVPTPAAAEKLTTLELILKYEYVIWATLFTLTAGVIWLVLLAQYSIPAFNDNHTTRDVFRSVALAPLGAWVRWAPTRLPQVCE